MAHHSHPFIPELTDDQKEIHESFMETSLRLAEKALDSGEFPVGCLLTHENQILVTGTRQGTANGSRNELDHAEIIALRKLLDLNPDIDHRRITLYCTMEPCLMCYSALILNGIGTIVYSYEDVMGGGTRCDLSRTAPLYAQSRISLIPYILRKKSLALFKNFFADPKNGYWQGSLLAQYTLAQEVLPFPKAPV